MKRVLVVVSLLIVLLSVNIHAQISLLDLHIGIDQSYRVLGAEANNKIVDLFNQREKAKTRYHVSLQFGVSITDKLYLKSGLEFLNTGYIRVDEEFFESTSSFSLKGVEVNPPGFTLSTIEQHSFINFPLMLGYSFDRDNSGLFVELGLASSFYQNTKRVDIIDGQSVEEKFDIEDRVGKELEFQMPIIFRAGYEYRLLNNLGIHSSLYYSRYLTKFIDFNVENLYFYNAGIEIGLRYHLR